MLILITGITGNIGSNVFKSALRRGHKVRGLGRDPGKLDASELKKLESFIKITDYQDKEAYERACSGVDAVINAWTAYPIMVLDAQLLLLRAAEKAGVKRFHAASWNLDWSNLPFGEIDSYDGMIAFKQQAFLTSTIRPCFVFTGVLAKTLFGVPGAGALEEGSALWTSQGSPKDNKRIIKVFGSADYKIPWTSEEDAADYSVALITSDYAVDGGFFRTWGDNFSLRELGQAFERARPGGSVEFQQVMDVETIKSFMLKTRAEARDAGPEVYQSRLREIAGLEYGYYLAIEVLNFEPVDAAKFPDCRRTTVEEYIKENDFV